MVVRCSSCKKVVIAPDPHQIPSIKSVYEIFDKKCACNNVYWDEETNNIMADGDAELWHPPQQNWVKYYSA